jgi:hypothetical protein
MPRQSPTKRSVELLRGEGWLPWVVEKWIPGTRITQDMWGFADICAAKEGERPVLVQTTTADNLSKRRVKILAEVRARIALAGGFRIVLHGWSPDGRVRIEEITEASFT